jgi:prepilin-type N-terminal cleavage/methylation domain-containing protein
MHDCCWYNFSGYILKLMSVIRCAESLIMKKSPCHTRFSGFTLIELLVVMAILALLAGVVGPKVMNALGESKSKIARVQLEALSAVLDIYRLDTGNYPQSLLVLKGEWGKLRIPGVGNDARTPYCLEPFLSFRL